MFWKDGDDVANRNHATEHRQSQHETWSIIADTGSSDEANLDQKKAQKQKRTKAGRNKLKQERRPK